ncbi:hypothetical protein BH09BAC3_BH09BAC3_30140 [soil metagenome]
MYRNQLLAIVYFALSTLFTWWFVVMSPLYISNEQMLLSTGVAGGKWGIQILAGFVLLGTSRWVFIRNIGFVCLSGSCILLPYVLLRVFHFAGSAEFFIGSLVTAVMVMIVLYFKAVKNSGVSLKWWHGWLVCLAIAISLQLTVVFHVF